MPCLLRELQPLWETIKNLAKGNGRLTEIDMTSPHFPYKACVYLHEAGIPCKIWGNDTEPFPGIQTDLSDLCILVPNPEVAALVLRDHAYIPTTSDPRVASIPEFRNAPRFVSPVPANIPVMGAVRSPNGELQMAAFQSLVFFDVTLLAAADWGYPLPDISTGLRKLIPRLHEHFDCTVEKWLDLEEDQANLRQYLGASIACDFSAADEFRTRCFKNQVRKEHRQLLFDLQAGVVDTEEMKQRECQLRHRDIRNRILQGQYKPVRPDMEEESAP